MPRKARRVIPKTPHHITQRGNNKQPVFETENDCLYYCHLLNKYGKKNRLDFLAFCLMPNHAHLIAVPEDNASLSKTLHIVNTQYAHYFNEKRKTCGHVWQGRYYSIYMDDCHLYRAIRYVEQNPVRGGIVRKPWQYRWSSARWHLKMDLKPRVFLKETDILKKKDWKSYLCEEDMNFMKELKKRKKGTDSKNIFGVSPLF